MLINLTSNLRSWSYTYDLFYRPIDKLKRKLDKFKKKEESSLPSGPSKPNLRREALTTIKQRAKIAATHYAATDQICKMNGAEFILLLQPTPRYKMNLTEEEMSRIRRKFKSKDLQRTHGQNEREFYDAFRETEKPFQFVDLSNIFSETEDTLYIDHYHYNDLAAEKLAEKILESIQPQLYK